MLWHDKLSTHFANLDKYYGLADSTLLSLFRFACGIAIARIAGSDNFAIYILLISAAVIFQTLPQTLYLTPLLNKGNSGTKENYTQLHCWAQKGITQSIYLFISIGAITLIFLPTAKLPIPTIVGFLGGTALLLLQNFYRARLQLEFKQRTALIVDSISIGSHILISGVIWKLFVDAQSAFWLGTFAAAGIGCWQMRRKLGHSLKIEIPDSQLEKAVLNNGRTMLIGSIANSACSRTIPFIIGLLSTAQAIAQFGVAWTLIGPIRMLSMALASLLRPRLSLFCKTNDKNAYKRTYYRALFIIALIGCSGIFASKLLGEWTIDLLFGSELKMASSILPIAVLYAMLDALTTMQMVARQIIDSNGPKITSKARVYAAVISLTLIVPLTQKYGLYGTITSLIIAELYYAIYLSGITNRFRFNVA